MAEEGLVLGRNEGVDDQRRIFVIGQLDPPFAGEGLDRIAVIAADVGRQRRLIGQQLFRARQAGREIDEHQRHEQQAAAPPPRPPAHPFALEPWVDAPMDALVEGDEVGNVEAVGIWNLRTALLPLI